jgi:hypothetical protein
VGASSIGAGDKKGDELKVPEGRRPHRAMTQQDKKKKCNADASAKALKGITTRNP